MEEKIVKIVTGIITGLSIIMVASVFYFPELHVKAEEAALLRAQKDAEKTAQMDGLEMLDYNTVNSQGTEEEDTFTQQLRIELPEGVTKDDITITDTYVTQTVTITIPGAGEDYLYDYPMLGSSDHIDSMMYESGSEQGVLDIVTDEVFELDVTYEDNYVYIDFLTPQQVYDKVVVIDAGHGSRAPGAIKQGIYEKDIDLAIVLALKQVFEENPNEKIGVYYTRTDDSNPTFDQRVQLANKSHADLFISVHNNSTKTGRMSSIRGTEVMYDEEKAEDGMSSKHLADICLEEVTGILGSENKGLTAGHEIYIIRTSEVPAALIEVGFMTNQEELDALNSPEYQRQAAQGIYNAIMRALEEGY